ncbi:MAG: hypothetical protein ACTS3R_00390 [Inquilinaceae bacterium]
MTSASQPTSEPLLSLALHAAAPERFPLTSVIPGPDGELQTDDVLRPTRYRFELEGVPFSVVLTPRDDGYRYEISALAGYVPYTCEGLQSRMAVLTVLRHCTDLRRARFKVDPSQAIWILADGEIEDLPVAEAVMYETVLFVQEVRPFLRLLEGCR